MTEAMDRAAQTCLGSPVRASARLHGGDLSDVFKLTLANGQEVVAKVGARVSTEARMLKAIGNAGTPAPRVLGVVGRFLFLEALPETAASTESWEALGHGLRQLHGAKGPHYGWDEDYAFGPVEIPNAPKSDWCDFWVENRLLAAPGALPTDLLKRLETLASRLSDWVPATPAASLLHGDLWSGNVLFSDRSAYVIDPASCYGHSEVDLAMLCLFGHPPEPFWSGYGRPDPGWKDRQPLYQLWPALVHLRLFGAGYRSMVETRLTALGV